MTDTDSAHLIDRATAGDAIAVDALLERYLPSVRAFLRLRAGKKLLDRESASDLAQSVCRDVLQNVGQFRYDGEDGFRRWLFKTAQRKILDRHAYYKAQKRAAERDLPADADMEATLLCYGDLVTPSRHAMAREQLERVELELTSLPEDLREVVILAKVVGMTRRAIADDLGKSEGAVRMMLHRALARIADGLAED